jgi:hypothetical protein
MDLYSSLFYELYKPNLISLIKMPKRRGGKAHHDVGGDMVDEYLKVIGSSLDVIDDMLVGKVTNHFGSGRFQVNLYSNHMDFLPEKQCVLCGRLRARFNRSQSRLNAGTVVLVQNNGIDGGREFEIVAIFKNDNLRILKGINKDLFNIVSKSDSADGEEDGDFEFEKDSSDSELDIGKI